jgi:hypothetical protein
MIDGMAFLKDAGWDFRGGCALALLVLVATQMVRTSHRG